MGLCKLISSKSHLPSVFHYPVLRTSSQMWITLTTPCKCREGVNTTVVSGGKGWHLCRPCPYTCYCQQHFHYNIINLMLCYFSFFLIDVCVCDLVILKNLNCNIAEKYMNNFCASFMQQPTHPLLLFT